MRHRHNDWCGEHTRWHAASDAAGGRFASALPRYRTFNRLRLASHASTRCLRELPRLFTPGALPVGPDTSGGAL